VTFFVSLHSSEDTYKGLYHPLGPQYTNADRSDLSAWVKRANYTALRNSGTIAARLASRSPSRFGGGHLLRALFQKSLGFETDSKPIEVDLAPESKPLDR
jgi:hypothetical protein